MSEDPECTDCEGSGVMHQTERYCTCSAGIALNPQSPHNMSDDWADQLSAKAAMIKLSEKSETALMLVAAELIKAMTARLAQRDAALKAADDLAVMLQNCLKVLTKEDGRLCCDGRECGCYGATKHQEAEHYANEALAAYRKARGQDATAKG